MRSVQIIANNTKALLSQMKKILLKTIKPKEGEKIAKERC